MRFLEQLENRSLLSVSPVSNPSATPAETPALFVPLAASAANLVGSYSGSIVVSGTHTQAIKATIATQAADGSFTGTVKDANDATVSVGMTGKVLADNTLTMTLSGGGSHPGGFIAGQGTGTVTISGSTVTLKLNFNFTQPFKSPGTVTLNGTQAVKASIVVTPPAAQTALAGTAKSFPLGSFAQTNATGPFSVNVNWGDGSANTKFSQASAGTIAPQSHKFTKAITNAVSVTITDSKGNVSNTAKFNVVVTPAAAAKLVFVKQPVTTVAGKAISPAVQVAIQDAFGNVVTTNTSTVTISKNTGPTGSTLTGTLAVAAVKGVATFSNLVLKTAGSYTLKAVDGALTSATSATFTVTPAAAVKLVYIKQPVTTVAGKPITPAVQVAIQDAFGNVVTTNTSTVTLSKSTGPTGSLLTGSLSVAAVKGVVTFSNLVLKTAGSYTLKAVDGALASATSTNFTVNPAAAAKLQFLKQPVTTVAGKAITPAVQVAIKDAFGNTVTANTSTVTISKNTGPTGSTLTGTLAVAAVKGVATFSNLVLKTAGSYTLKAVDGALTSAISTSFTVTPAAAAKLVFIKQPVSTTHGKPITPAVQVAIQDAFGNVVTTNTSTVTISKNTGPAGSTLTGTLSVAAVKGVASFTNLILNLAGSYKLKAVDGLLASATSVSFSVT